MKGRPRPATASPAQSRWRELLRQRRFQQLLAARLTSQAADGVFQASLASAVFFNPEHHASAARVASGFVVLLLPYSLVGPFAGVFLDRWRRQRVLVYGALVRSVVVVVAAGLLVRQGPAGLGFEVAALGALSINRFYLADLGASLPSVLTGPLLVAGNALSPTAGTVATIAGGGVGLGLRELAGGGDAGNAVACLAAAVGYVVAGWLATRLPADSLGPASRDESPLRAQLAGTVRGLVAGANHIRRRPAAAAGLGMICGQRLLFGVWSIMALLLYRNHFHDTGLLRAGIVGFGQAVAAGGIGFVIAAVVAPTATARFGLRRWIVLVTAFLAVAEFALGLQFGLAALLIAALATGFATQSTKICVDTLIQEQVSDEFRGRAFAFYDTAFNVSFVAAAVVAALSLPASGTSTVAVTAIAVGYAVLALGYSSAASTVASGPEARRAGP